MGGSPGEQWAGGVRIREKKGREAGSLRWREAGEKFKKAGFRYLLLLTSSQRNEPNNVPWLPFNVFRGLTQNFIHEKSQNTKIRTRDEKKKKNSITSCEIGNLSKSLTSYDMNEIAWHMYTCVDCASRVSVSSVSLAVEILRKNDKASKVKCRQRPFSSVSVFFGVVGKNPSIDCSSQEGMLLQWSLWRVRSGSIYNTSFYWFRTRPKHSLLE